MQQQSSQPAKRNARPLLQRLIQTGTASVPIDKAHRVIVVNTLSMSSALLAFSFSIIIFAASGDPGILAAGLAETLFFSLFLVLNRYHKHNVAAIGYMLIHNIALFYFAVLRGMVAEERLLLVFLFICSLLLFSALSHILISILLSTSILAVAKVNELLQQLPVSAVSQEAAGPFHDLGTIALFVLILVAVSLFKHQDIKLIRALRQSNESLEGEVRKRTKELDDANVALLERTHDLDCANNNLKYFFNQLSHDMRNKLHVIIHLNRLLRKEAGHIVDDLVVYLDHMQTAVSGLQDMLSDVMTMKLIESGQFNTFVEGTVDLRKWLQDLVSTNQYIATARDVKVHLSVDGPLPHYIKTDPVKLDKVISNLLSNAIKHTRTVVVLKVSAGDSFLNLEVRDRGEGIPQDKLHLVFNKDYATGGGNGLGLYIVRWICHSLAIQINVQSTVGRGTTFYLKVPFEKGKAEDVARIAAEADAIPDLSGRLILTADDDTVNLFVLKRNLQAAGGTVLEARDGAEMLRLARENRVDLVIMDNKMPVMDGIAALESLRSDTMLRNIPVILMTASTMEEVLKADADDYLTKPVMPEDLLDSVGKLLGAEPVRNHGRS